MGRDVGISFLYSSLSFHLLPFLQSLLLRKYTFTNTLDEALTEQINAKETNLRIQLKALYKEMRTATVLLLGQLYLLHGRISKNRVPIL